MQSSRGSEWPPPEARATTEPTPPTEAEEAQRLRAELARMEDRYKRALADLENYRKRSDRETERRVQEARALVMREWLQSLDSVERALRTQPGDLGLQAVLAQMEAILAREGVTRVGAAGEVFDPAYHHAVAVRSSAAVPDHTIIEVTRSGFALGDKVLRPAEVVVSQRPGGE